MTTVDPGLRQGVLGDAALFAGMTLPQDRARLAAERSRMPALDPVMRVDPRSPRPLTRETVAGRVELSPTIEATERIQRIWDQGVLESRQFAQSLAFLAPSWLGRDTGGCTQEDADCEDIVVATALRCSETVAYRRIREAHRAVDLCPRTFARLLQGEFPAAWFRELLRRSGSLTDEEMALLDASVSRWDEGITSEHFGRCLGNVITTLLERRELPPHLDVEARRRVELDHGREDGTACLQMTGPVPDVLGLSRRLDASARAVQAAQRRALEAGTTVPMDPHGEAAEAGRPLSLATLRFLLLTSAELDTDGVEVPVEAFRMNVTVPLFTLMGHSDAPGMLDGTIPIPADMARELAAGEEAWYRLLTDASSGEFVPAPAQRYSVPRAMREHLRVRMSTCAVPGCRRPASCATEADHIQEYDHADPSHGGRTSVDNLHLLCWQHHALKTARRIDPVRMPAAASPTGRAGTRWSLSGQMHVFQEDDTDLATPGLVADLEASWASILAARRERRERERQEQERWERERQAPDPPLSETPDPPPPDTANPPPAPGPGG
ncbi:HNH endonuclease signature motif containing protein [Brachybacterium endophyticum]|nr:HNH endonuclease signature motif containing protein [Brachybacterium endophyticum]